MQYQNAQKKRKKTTPTYIESTFKNNNTLIVIIGPTAGKKSALAKRLQSTFNWDVVNSDIYKAYKDSEIWVNQLPSSSLTNPKYHLYGFLEPKEKMNVAIYQRICRDKISELLKKGNVVLVGGSCLYMNAVLFNEYDFSHKGKQKRPEVFTNFFPETTYIGLDWDREEIYNIISNRVDNMFRFGINGPKHILQSHPDTLLSRAIGYKEWKGFIDGTETKEDVIENIKRNTRRYAKRQLTWYRHQYTNVNWNKISLSTMEKVFLDIINSLKQDG